ncbi:hypothetical protein NMG60_11028595 [Bertholletia excelsa]
MTEAPPRPTHQPTHTLHLLLSSQILPEFSMERGKNYEAYAKLRESKLRMKNKKQQQSQEIPRKQVKGTSFLTRSVADFSPVLRKENRKPPTPAPLTPPHEKMCNAGAKLAASKSVKSGEKRAGRGVGRRSFGSMEELKGLSLAAWNGINGENRGGVRTGRSSRA